jgi:SAM-dependent methyltransferase
MTMTRSRPYAEFLAHKSWQDTASGFTAHDVNPLLFDFQQDVVGWATRKGKAALFLDCGLGKSAIQLDWARLVHDHTGGDVLVLAPLAVAQQTRREAEKFHIAAPVAICRTQDDVRAGINIANYEMLQHFDPAHFAGVVLDESSILKSQDGKTRTAIIEAFRATPYRLACTATPAPNDHMELGNHAEFLGAMTRAEMLAMFFTHDGGDTSQWRLKRHAERAFWEWVASWAVLMRRPADLGYPDGGFALPPLNVTTDVIDVGMETDDALFVDEARTLTEQRQARKTSLSARVAAVAERVNASDEPFLVWCDLNAESEALAAAIPDAVAVTGSDSPDHKESALLGFADGKHRVLVSKPSIAGFGMNFQHCPNMEFVGISHSWEAYYQAIRRCWRFGQDNPVQVTITVSNMETPVVDNIRRKEADSVRLAEGMVEHTAAILTSDIHGTTRDVADYVTGEATGDGWRMIHGDCVEQVATLPDESVGFSVFSPPFASLYTYSNSDRDMGNSKDLDQFAEHFRYLVRELYRVLKPGRLVSFHCMNLPTSKVRDGYIGIEDFRGDLIRAFREEGFIFHSEVVIWKDPVIAMQRTKALGLLHKQIKKDSCMSRQGIPDYLVTMRKPGVNPDPVEGPFDHYEGDSPPDTRPGPGDRYSIEVWQRYASPVWMDINPSDTLQYRSAREHDDERHICPLQLQVIHRALQLWSNPGDMVLSPFAGIGSEGWESIRMGRRFIGVELKSSYYREACRNLKVAVQERDTETLFDMTVA